MFTILLLFGGLAAAAALKTTTTNTFEFGDYTFSRLPVQRGDLQSSELRVTDKVIELERVGGASISSKYIRAIRDANRDKGEMGGVSRVANETAPIDSLAGGQVFAASVMVGGQEFTVVIDTGSSDPWLITTSFDCFSIADDAPQGQSYCSFGPLYDSGSSETFVPIQDQNFNITYADGEYLVGTLGYETFRMGGIEVDSQTFGVIDHAAWNGDGTTSGLVGFAYRALVSAHRGTDPTADTPGDKVLYNPLFVNMYEKEGTLPVFSLAIDRDESKGGVMALGGIPDVPHSPYFASTPIVPYGVDSTDGTQVYEFYEIQSGGFAISNSANTQFNIYDNDNPTKTPVVGNGTALIVDSGTSLCYLPNDIAMNFIDLFGDSVQYDTDFDTYFADCDAPVPVFGVVIGGKIFYMNPEDLLIPFQNGCVIGVQPSGGGLNILGGSWMKNVIAVFDVGAEEMRFAAREFYPTS